MGFAHQLQLRIFESTPVRGVFLNRRRRWPPAASASRRSTWRTRTSSRSSAFCGVQGWGAVGSGAGSVNTGLDRRVEQVLLGRHTPLYWHIPWFTIVPLDRLGRYSNANPRR